MGFNYSPNAAPPAQGIKSSPMSFSTPNYGQGQQSNTGQLDYSNQFPAEQQKKNSIDPQVVAKLLQQFMGSPGSDGATSGLLSQGSGSTGLGGSGLIGGAGGAMSAADTGGASYGLGGSLVGGSGEVGGSTFASGAGSGSAAGGGLMSGLGGLGALAGLSYLGDKEMNESKNSPINADKLNNMGTIGKSGIGFRGGDLVNGFNPGTWVSDPGKAAKGLVNVFTLGFLNKWL